MDKIEFIKFLVVLFGITVIDHVIVTWLLRKKIKKLEEKISLGNLEERAKEIVRDAKNELDRMKYEADAGWVQRRVIEHTKKIEDLSIQLKATMHTHPKPGPDHDMITYETFVEKLPELRIDHKLRAHLGLKVCDSCNKLKEKCVEITVDRGKYTVMDGPYPVSPQTAQKIRDGYKHICPACLKEAKSAKSN